MRTIFFAVLPLAFISSAALASDCHCRSRGPPNGSCRHHDADADATNKTMVIHKDEGCATKTVKKSDEMGNSVSKIEDKLLKVVVGGR